MIEQICNLTKAKGVTVSLSVWGQKGDTERKWVATVYPPNHGGFGKFGKTPEEAMAAVLEYAKQEFGPKMPPMPKAVLPTLPSLPKLPNV